MSLVARAFAVFGLLLAPAAFAEDAKAPGTDAFTDTVVMPEAGTVLPPPSTTLETPDSSQLPATASPIPIVSGPHHKLALEARLVTGGETLNNGLIWRVFGAHPGADGQLPLFAETPAGGSATLDLPRGDYFVHAAFGRAGATKHVTIADNDESESLVLDAGGLKLDSVVGEDRPIPPSQLTFEVMQQDESGEMVTVVPNASPGRVLRLSAGTYHVVSHYGNVNAVVRADIEVQAGKLTEAVMRHTGAEVTLKLVSEEGGEALANTSWTVTTQDGTTVHESVGAFPSIILAAGTYTAVAKHANEIYSRDFTVEPGLQRDIEVHLTDVVQPETGPVVNPASGGEPMEP